MFGNMRSLEIDYKRILDVCGEGTFVDMLAKAGVVSIVNWTMIPKMTSILVEIVDRIMPNLPRETLGTSFRPHRSNWRSAEDIREVLRVISRFQAHSKSHLVLISTRPFRYPRPLVWTKATETRIPSRKWQRRFAENWKLPALSFTGRVGRLGQRRSLVERRPRKPKNHNRRRRRNRYGLHIGQALRFLSAPSLALATCTSGPRPYQSRPPVKPSNCSKGRRSIFMSHKPES